MHANESALRGQWDSTCAREAAVKEHRPDTRKRASPIVDRELVVVCILVLVAGVLTYVSRATASELPRAATTAAGEACT
jgi:hypothetical protein